MREWCKRNPEKARANDLRRYMRVRKESPEKVKEYAARYRKKHGERIARKALEKAYGITFVEFEGMLVAQNGVCAICRGVNPSGERLSVDHDHRTNRVRGLLCRKCNAGIGHFKDGAALLRAAAEYIERNTK